MGRDWEKRREGKIRPRCKINTYVYFFKKMNVVKRRWKNKEEKGRDDREKNMRKDREKSKYID